MDYIVSDMAVIMISTALLCFIAQVAKQPLIIAYIFAGLLVGPNGLDLIHGNGFFEALSQIGVVLLLYLIGLELKPMKFAETLKKSYKIALITSLGIAPFSAAIGWITGLTMVETIYLTVAFLFSSTVVVLKTLDDERGSDEDVVETCIGVLLIQDMMAIIALLVINSLQSSGAFELSEAVGFISKGILFTIGVFMLQSMALRPMLKKIMERTDLIFLIGLAWCFLIAEIGHELHLSREIGGFIAGLSLTSLPMRKQRVFVFKSSTIRDFFMILFFFVLGANLQITSLSDYSLLIALSLGVILLIKPILYYLSSRLTKHNKGDSREIGVRLGQISEFSVIVGGVAFAAGQISHTFYMVISMILVLSIIFSSFIVKYHLMKK